MSLCANLSFNGDCRKAFEFYAKCFAGTISFMGTYAGSPLESQFGPEMAEKIMHASLQLESGMLTGNDVRAADYRKPQGFSLLYSLNDVSRAETIFRELSEGGAVQMPMEKTFWAERFGVVIDRFGIPWAINCAA
ncbi:MAG TPA: VOC family protein [Bryobacteraceae bacterium]|nr:VOC family protein [Bryobacteraceae bacterium]